MHYRNTSALQGHNVAGKLFLKSLVAARLVALDVAANPGCAAVRNPALVRGAMQRKGEVGEPFDSAVSDRRPGCSAIC